MTEWTPKLEKLVSKLGDYVETQLRDLVDPKASVMASALRIGFRTATTGAWLLEKTYRESGLVAEGAPASMWEDGRLQKLVDLAEENGSAAASKIKRGIAVVGAMKENATGKGNATLPDSLKRIRQIKQKNLKF